ncbi:hypothetical protein GeomeDRAFT_0423 [Geobacter metallireducens RCH3]|uniref:Transmembrane protein n=1 Tax=Geobacter metallireducens (strain ATCC 53774 / DSM 7210 / GS-15) TaxID=269799 RepID=Q39S99_GEOMG|nr:hypothetical protein [Geobacter metallireducens]ABB32875.1 hypothetical protein Gmet_2657 [Geobacter metallireducens GS-15]EHP88991.1 hypothetical protein GeomeDRAFT_0423 [Geobacter metallireducens RCH3]
MGEITRQARAELRQLPLMLGKLAGGIAAVIGFTAAVVIVTRRPGALDGLLPALLAGCAGVAVFVLSAWALRGRLAGDAAGEPLPARRARTSLLAWGLLLFFAGVFLAWAWFMTR